MRKGCVLKAICGSDFVYSIDLQNSVYRFSDDEMEDRKHIRLSAYNRRRIPEWYGRKILKLGKKGQVGVVFSWLTIYLVKETSSNKYNYGREDIVR